MLGVIKSRVSGALAQFWGLNSSDKSLETMGKMRQE